MRTRYGLIGAAIAGLMVAGALAATSAPALKVTGGGQTLNGTEGAGDTIAFVAQDTDGTNGIAARGQVQYIDREDGTQTVLHGLVTCLRYESSNSARFAGDWVGGGTFEIAVTDRGEGSNAQDDLIGVFPEAEPDCANDNGDDDDATTALARGNVQVH
jgi:hypothetical protein